MPTMLAGATADRQRFAGAGPGAPAQVLDTPRFGDWSALRNNGVEVPITMFAPTLSRFAVPFCAALLLGGCLEHPLKPVKYDKSTEGNQGFAIAVNKDVDILFVIDNSGSMAEEQALLSANFKAFIDVLEHPEVNANYRIGITTTDSGNPRCPTTTPEGGRLGLSSCVDRAANQEFSFLDEDFSFACSDFCQKDDSQIKIKPTSTVEEPTAKPRTWLESIEGETNVEGVDSMVEAFQCFGPQGVAGCGLESHLESMYRALAASSDAKSSNYGFLRDSAILSVVMITDETDCSLNPAAKEIFANNKVFWDDPANDVAPTSATCWNAGVQCTGDGGTYSECHAENYDIKGEPGAADADAVLLPISKYVEFLQGIEDAKRMKGAPDTEVLVSLIAGVPRTYGEGTPLVYQDSDDPDFQKNFGIGPGCVLPSDDPLVDDQSAVPPVREREFAEAFEVDGERNLYSICQTDYSGALKAIADALVDQIKPACMPSCVRDLDTSTPFADVDCQLFDALADGTRTEIVPCEEVGGVWTAPAGESVCFAELVDTDGTQTPSKNDDMSEDCTKGGLNLEFKIVRAGSAPGGSSVSATCQLTDNKRRDCPLL